MPSDDSKKTPNARSKRKSDDLTSIPGIDEPLRKWLNTSIGVYTYNDLANISVKKLSDAARRDSRVLPVNIIRSMIANAKAQITRQPENDAKKNVKTDISEYQHKEWNEVATIVIYVEENTLISNVIKSNDQRYRTLVHHIESGSEQNWPGLDVKNVCEWLNSQLDDLARTIKILPVKTDQLCNDGPLIDQIDAYIINKLTDQDEIQSVGGIDSRPSMIRAHEKHVIMLRFKFSAAGNGYDSIQRYLSEFIVEQQYVNTINNSVIKNSCNLSEIEHETPTEWIAVLPIITSTIGVYVLNLQLSYSVTKKIYKKLNLGLLHIV
jgi:hypothetical protein